MPNTLLASQPSGSGASSSALAALKRKAANIANSPVQSPPSPFKKPCVDGDDGISTAVPSDDRSEAPSGDHDDFSELGDGLRSVEDVFDSECVGEDHGEDSDDEVSGSTSAQTVASTAVVAVNKSTAKDGWDVECTICRSGFYFKQCTCVGSKAYPVYRCKPCNAAVKSLERKAASHGSDASAALSRLKGQNVAKYRLEVLRFRIKPEGERDLPHEKDLFLIGPVDCRARRDSMSSYMETWQSRWSLTVVREVVFMSQRQFVAYYIVFEGYSKEEAAQHWIASLNNRSVEREYAGDGQLTLAVHLPKRVQVIQSYSFSRQLAGKTAVGDDQWEDFYKAVRRDANLDTKGSFLEGAGKALEPGAHAKGVDVPEGSACFAGVPVAGGGGGGGSSKMAGAAGSSGGGTSRKAKAGESAELSSLGAGSVTAVRARTVFKKEAKRVLSTCYGRKTSAYNKLATTVQTLGVNHAEVRASKSQDLLASFLAKVKVVETFITSCDGWTPTSAGPEFSKATQAVQLMESSCKELEEAVKVLKQVRLHAVHQGAGDRRKLGLAVKKVLGALEDQEFPKPLMLWLGHTLLGVRVGEYEKNFTECDALEYKDNFSVDEPWLWTAENTSDVKANVIAHMGSFAERIVTVKKSISESFAGKDPEMTYLVMMTAKEKKSAQVNVNATWETRLQASESDPSFVTAEAIGSFGAPWVFGSAYLGCRQGMIHGVLTGIGCFVVGLSGTTLVVTWPMASTLAAGAAVTEHLSYLSGLSAADASKFMSGHASWRFVQVVTVSECLIGFVTQHPIPRC